MGMPQRDAATLRVLTDDVIKTSEIEGEHARTRDPSALPSPAAWAGHRRPGAGRPARRRRGRDGARRHRQLHAPLTRERLFGWHAALFPTGYSGLAPDQHRRLARRCHGSDAGGLRPRRSRNGCTSRRRPRRRLEAEMARFLDWVESSHGGDPADQGRACAFVVRHPAPLRRRQRPHRPCRRRHVAGPRGRQPAALLQPVGADPARAQGLLRHPGAHAERHDGCHAVAGLVPRLLHARRRGRSSIADAVLAKTALLAALGRRRR